ncbi:MAG: type IV secretion system DNA-binding domain-containing protein [Steroidobacteraceae bacterium]
MPATIVENCGNTLILRCSASEAGGTAQFASRLIGEREIIRRQITRTRRPGDLQSARTESLQHTTELAVLPSEIEQLPDLTGYLKLASIPHWQLVSLRPRSYQCPRHAEVGMRWPGRLHANVFKHHLKLSSSSMSLNPPHFQLGCSIRGINSYLHRFELAQDCQLSGAHLAVFAFLGAIPAVMTFQLMAVLAGFVLSQHQ